MSCAACGAGPPTPKLEKQGVLIQQCPSCGLAYWSPPDDFRPEDTYDESYFGDSLSGHGYDDYSLLEASHRKTFARRLSRLPRPHRDARLLDIGAAYGYSVAEGRKAGWTSCGIEVSIAAARRARAVGDGSVAVASALATPFGDACFDGVTMWDVLEHLADPQAAIREIARVLRPGGRLALTTGDVGSLLARLSGARWHLYTLPEHLFFFTRESLRRLLGANGFEVEHIGSEASFYTLGYLAERLRKTLLGRASARPATWPGSSWKVPVNLFDIVLLTAIRKDTD